MCLSVLLWHTGTPRVPSRLEMACFKYDCTCGQCLEGYLSPRMASAILYQAQLTMKRVNAAGMDSILPICEEMCPTAIKSLTPAEEESSRNNSSVREGVIMVLGFVMFCILKDVIPNEHATQKILNTKPKDRPVLPSARDYLQAVGRKKGVATVVQAALERAKTYNAKAGHERSIYLPSESSPREADLRRMPACRNDREFGFIAAMWGVQLNTYKPSGRG
ncbi:hypothetical protein BDW74DRAFT_147947 [Aspergillus multicolor]|uniref:uncharacterized protein n=1 Tax=Aspergillus multicolor TaxID=41759 RepID=UPI003CCE4028